MIHTSDLRQKTGMRALMFHAVVHELPGYVNWRERKYWMPFSEFCSHIDLLKSTDQPVVDLEEAWNGGSGKSSPVVLTFDDGHASDAALVWPLLREAGWSATFFVNTATLDHRDYLNWNEVKAMSAAGARFGSHGHRHVDLTSLGASALRDELRRSKDLLEDQLGLPVHFLAVPYGRVSGKVIAAALATGYRAVCTSTPGLASPADTTIKRVAIHAGTSRSELSRIVAGKRFAYLPRLARAACLSLPKRFLATLTPDHGTEPRGV